MTENESQAAAAKAINAELAEGYADLSVEDCRLRYGAALQALAKALHQNQPAS
jgi:hypothetical protein